MGLIETIKGYKICIDTAPFIYLIEENHVYLKIIRPIFAAIADGHIEAITSTITLLEVLVHPLRIGDEILAGKYRDILLSSSGLTTYEISHELSEKASRMRAKYSIRTPDAIQIAAGILYGASYFLTNDPSLKRISEIRTLVLDDYLD